MKNKTRSNFIVLSVNEKYILIKDLYDSNCPTVTVTNDAENVVKFIIEYYKVKNEQIFYIDTNGRVDELLHDGSEFIGFKFGYNNLEEFVSKYNNIK